MSDTNISGPELHHVQGRHHLSPTWMRALLDIATTLPWRPHTAEGDLLLLAAAEQGVHALSDEVRRQRLHLDAGIARYMSHARARVRKANRQQRGKAVAQLTQPAGEPAYVQLELPFDAPYPTSQDAPAAPVVAVGAGDLPPLPHQRTKSRIQLIA